MSRDRESRRISTLIFYGTVLLLAWLAYRIVEPFLVQIGWAVVLAICLDPIQTRLRPRLGPTRTALLLTALVVVLLVLPGGLRGHRPRGRGAAGRERRPQPARGRRGRRGLASHRLGVAPREAAVPARGAGSDRQGDGQPG